MKKPKNECDAEDRLSELPESLIIVILGFLPLTDVVRTTILSKHWNNLWTTIPSLDFSFVDSKIKNKDKYREFVYGALRRWRGARMVRFNISIFDSQVAESFSNDDVDRWVRYAVEKDVEEMGLWLPSTPLNGGKNMYSVAQELYSCSSLKILVLASCNVEIHGDMQWGRLKILAIVGVVLDEECVNKILHGCPRLENLSLISVSVSVSVDGNDGKLNISSSSLRRLSIDSHRCPLKAAEVRISAPKLEYFRFSGDGYIKRLLMNNMPSMRVAKIDFSKVPQNVVVEMLARILPLIKHVEKVSLSDVCIKALGAMKEKGMLPSFPDAYYLKLKRLRLEEYEQIVGVVEMFPRLRELVLRTARRGPPEEGKNAESRLNLDRSLPESFLLKLRRVEVRNCGKGDEAIIPLVQILLKYARNLQNMEFWGRVGERRRKLLLKIERSSPNEELIFDHTNLFLK